MSNRRDLIAGLLGAAGAAAVGQAPGQAQAAPGLSDADVERIADAVEARLEAKERSENRWAMYLKMQQEGWLSAEAVRREMMRDLYPPMVIYRSPNELQLPAQLPYSQTWTAGDTKALPPGVALYPMELEGESKITLDGKPCIVKR